MRPGLLALLAPLLVAQPALAQDFRCPDRGGPAWREVRSAHVLLQTDLSSGKARELAQEVERMYEVVLHGLFRTPPPPLGLLRVIALRSEEEFGLFAPKNAAAYYRAGDVYGPTIVMPGVFAEAQRIVVAHEITHHVTAQVFARQPRWFSEGLASYMETVGSSGPNNTPTMGGIPRYLYRLAFPYHGGIGRVLTATDLTDDTGRPYALAWALVHFLVNHHPQELGQLEARFARGQDPAVAWREVFPRWDPASRDGADALDRELGGYLGRGKFGYRDVKLPPAQPVAERPMSAAEAHGVRLSLPWINRGEKVEPARVRAETDEALAHDAGHVAALALLAAGAPPEERLRLAERATAAHPEDVRAWLLLGRALPPAEERRRIEAYQRATAADGTNATALNDLAWTLLGAGRSGEALPLARKAAGLDPWSAPVLDTYAGVLEDLGQCGEALAVQRRAADVLSEHAREDERAPYLKRLARLERSCGQPAAPRPSAAP
jgi:tetratricopeptide (TPR) repeat protein